MDDYVRSTGVLIFPKGFQLWVGVMEFRVWSMEYGWLTGLGYFVSDKWSIGGRIAKYD